MPSARLFSSIVLVAALLAPASASALTIGIADQRPGTFADPALRELDVPVARVVVSWDDAIHRPQRVDAWLTAVRAAGMRPLVSFNDGAADACPASPCVLPSVSAYRRAVAAFHGGGHG